VAQTERRLDEASWPPPGDAALPADPRARDEPLNEAAAAAWRALQSRRPHVHCITNTVVQALTANVLLAAGALPTMASDPDEIADFVDRCDALLVNLGTLDGSRRQAIERALALAAKTGKTWVLDPVFVDVASGRLRLALELLQHRPAVVRANAAEMAALFGTVSLPRLSEAAAGLGTVLCVSGETDLIIDGRRLLKAGNGHAMAARVTGTGCALAAIVAALIACNDDQALAAAAAHACYGLAVEAAAAGAAGPGSLAARLPDQLYRLDETTITRGVRMTCDPQF
jgi:hydroxyethylthiazole kinase